MRLGAYPAVLEPESIVAQAYQTHRGVRAAPAPLRGEQRLPRPYRRERAAVLRAPRPTATSSSSSSTRRTCIRSWSAPRPIPELKSRPTRPHPLFAAFIGAALDYKAAERLPVEIAEHRANGADERPCARSTLPTCRWCRAAAARARAPWLHTTSRRSSSETLYVGKIFALRADEVRMPGGRTARREVVEHYGAVAIVAMDDDNNVALVYQYRHAVGATAVGTARRPARHRGRTAALTAARELEEEAGLAARDWARAGRRASPRRGSATRCVRVLPRDRA